MLLRDCVVPCDDKTETRFCILKNILKNYNFIISRVIQGITACIFPGYVGPMCVEGSNTDAEFCI